MIPHRPILALDASGAACSAALWRDGLIAAHRFRLMPRGHAEALVPMAVDCLAEAGCRFSDLGMVAATVGPGAFTGLRIGLAAARGIALAAALPFAGVTSFAAIAEAVPKAQRAARSLWVALDSKRGDLFVQRFAPGGGAIGEPAIVTPAALVQSLPAGDLVIAGDAASLLGPLLAGYPRVACVALAAPDAACVAVVAARLTLAAPAGAKVVGLPPKPLYLRRPEVTMPADTAP